MRVVATLLVLAFSLVMATPSGAAAGSSQGAASRAQTKLRHIERNSELDHPDRTSTEFSEDEINAYFASGVVALPAGVQSVTFQGQPGVVTASCRVDFDQVEAGQRSANPLLSLFSGVHDVVVVANASGNGGVGLVKVQSVSLDGIEIPRFVLELFVERFLQPKYPEIGLDSRFQLPQRIDTATVGMRNLTITQK